MSKSVNLESKGGSRALRSQPSLLLYTFTHFIGVSSKIFILAVHFFFLDEQKVY